MNLSFGRRMLLATICSVAVATIYVAQPVLAQVGRALGVEEAGLGWIVAAGQVGYLIGLVALVPLGDILDRRLLICGHLLLASIGMVLTAVATQLWLLLVGLGLAGLFAVVVQITVAFAADLATATDRGRTIGVVTSGVVIGILGARVLAGSLAALWGWRSVYVVLAVLLVVLTFFVATLLPADHRRSDATYGQTLVSVARLWRDQLFVSRGLIAFFVFASFSTLWSGLALPLSAEPWHLSTAQIGLFGIAGIAGALGAARAGIWADAGRARLVTGGALALLAASWLASGQAHWSLWLIVVGVIVLDFAVQAAHVSNQHLLASAYPHRRSSVVGGYMLFYSLGSALGATATTAAYSAAGWTGSAVLGAAFAVCALLVWASAGSGSGRTAGGRRMRGADVSPAPPLGLAQRAASRANACRSAHRLTVSRRGRIPRAGKEY